MSLSRQEINLRRLLAKCEIMYKTQKDDPRFPKYITSLDNMLTEVKNLIEPSNNVIKVYQNRINALKSELGVEIKEMNTSDYQSMRDDLFDLKRRNVNKANKGDDLDEIMSYNEEFQKKITDNILDMTANLKEQSKLANKIIKKDTNVLTRSSTLTDQNRAKLEVESSKLEEHSRKGWKCWMWIMILVVMIVFFNMVMFMKVMKKN